LTNAASPSFAYSKDDGFFHKRWTVSECRFLVDSGLLEPSKFELIDGEIVAEMGQGREHIACITRIIAALSGIFDPQAIQSQAPIGIGEIDEFNDPEPDVAVLRGTVQQYLASEPDPRADVLLAVEAANTTLQGDLITKAHIYGKNGIPEYWVVAIERRQLIVHRSPNREGGYDAIQTLDVEDSVTPLTRPDATISVADLLP